MKFLGSHSEGGFAPAGSVIGVVAIALQLGGGTPLGKAIEQLERSVTKPVPQAPASTVVRPDSVWVPDRQLPDVVHGGTVLVPGHWERRLSDREYYAPPLTICGSATGECATIPAGVRPPPAERQTP